MHFQKHFSFLLFVAGVAGLTGCSSLRKPASVSERKQMKISELLVHLESTGQLESIDALIRSCVQELVPQKTLQVRLLSHWEEARRKKDFSLLDRFPVVPLAQAENLRTAFGGRGGQNEKIDVAVVKGDLEDILGECREMAPLPKMVNPKIPMLTDGHFPAEGLSLCEQDRSIKLARVLNSLMAVNGSEVRLGSVRARSAQKLIEALIESGHRVEMRNERTYANFVSLNWGDTPVIWPVWVDTGLKTSEGQDLRVPVGHSHHAWRIEGPLMKAKVMFYLGVSGVGFFAQVDERPAWTGLRAEYVLDSDRDRDSVIKAMDYAGRYYRRIQKEARAYAADMPADGYGYLGVCNDSNAVLEKATRGSVSTFPLMRAADLDGKPRMTDGLDDILRSLPKDSRSFERSKNNLARVLSMTPFEDLDDPRMHDDGLRSVLKSLDAELRR